MVASDGPGVNGSGQRGLDDKAERMDVDDAERSATTKDSVSAHAETERDRKTKELREVAATQLSTQADEDDAVEY